MNLAKKKVCNFIRNLILWPVALITSPLIILWAFLMFLLVGCEKVGWETEEIIKAYKKCLTFNL